MAEQAKNKPHLRLPLRLLPVRVAAHSKVEVVVAMTDATRHQKRLRNLKK